MKLTYRAVTPDGKSIRGIIEAKNVQEVAVYLRSKQLVPINISQADDFMGFLPFGKKIKSKDIVLFTRQLSSMLTSGITLIRALEILKEQIPNPAMLNVINGIATDIQEGSTFAKAIEKYPQAFSGIYVAIVRAGETSGFLDKMLMRLADNLEKSQKLRSTVKGALLYPLIVMLMMTGVMFIMLVFVIPKLTGLYKDMNVKLPLITQITIGASNFVSTFWPVLLAGTILIYYALHRWRKTADGKLATDGIILKLPVFGKVVRGSILAEFSRTLGLLIGAGTPVVQALLQTADTAGNALYQRAIKDMSEKVQKGIPTSEAMNAYVLFPQLVTQLVKIGEETGKVDESLLKASEYFENEVDQLVKNLTTALEPFILIFLGVAVGVVIISVITPIYGLISNIQ